MSIVRRFILILIITLLAACIVGSASAQSPLQNIIRTYKDQNLNGNRRETPTSRQPHQGQNEHGVLVASHRQLSETNPTSAPVGSTAPLSGDLRDPLNVHFTPYFNPATVNIISPYNEMRFDARLNDAYFVDQNCGWIVGDRGTIWHTEDGGITWILQETPISCSLRSVCFIDNSFGVAVGGYYFPFSTQGRGVVLTTHDGGKNWSMQQTPDMPVLHRVKILDPMKIILAGESSDYHPTGLFITLDSGRTWKTVFGGKTEGWVAADFFDEKIGAGIGTKNSIQIFRNETSLSQTPAFGSARLAAIKLIAGTTPPGNINGWIVGDGGLILSTQDRGLRWSVAGKLPGNSAAMIDLSTIEAQGTNLWVAGNPGTMIYSSANLGQTWKATPSGVSVPIRKIVFTDAKNGWAVGELGTILKTDDGGASWKTQRAGGSRLAVLGLFGRSEDIPLEAYASLCAHQGYLGGAVLLFRDEDRKIENWDSDWLDRVHEATIRTGACGAWEIGTFPIKRKELQTTLEILSRQLQKESDGKGMERLRERIVATIRLWQPEIILTAELGNKKDPVRELVVREIMESVKMADDPAAFPYQLTELGLKPWKVKRIHVAQDDGVLGDVNLATTEPSIRLGLPLDEIALSARGLIEMQQVSRPAMIGFTTPYDEANVITAGHRDFFAGLNIIPGGDARRGLVGAYTEQWEAIQLRTKQRRQTLGIIQHTAKVAKENGRQAGDVRLASNAAELTRKIDQDAAVQILFEMGQDFHAVGDWESALEAFDIIAKQYTNHPFARQAFLWLLQYYTAEETNWRKHKDNVIKTGEMDLKTGQTSWNTVSPTFDRHKIDPCLDKGFAVGKYLERNFPDLADDVKIRFALASALRRRGFDQDALKYYHTRGDLKFDDVWGMRARAELWLGCGDKSELPPEQRELPMPSIHCSFTSVKPLLDGKFDKQFDQAWFNAQVFSLTPEKPRFRLQEMLKDKKTGSAGLRREEMDRTDSQNLGTQVMLMYDKEFLFVGLRCKRVAGFSYPPLPEKPRSRDIAINDQDRIEILIDIDRDYGTYYSLSVDSRGWIVDSCWGDQNWNPKWFVARHEDKNFWYIEAAIPLESLTDQFPLPKTVWGIGIRRIVPGVGIECWNAENSFNLTEGLGFLVFE